MQKTVRKPILVVDDPWLEPYTEEINSRIDRYNNALDSIKENAGSLEKFADAYKYFGIQYDKVKKGWTYREWAPAAFSLSLIGDFNNWDKTANPLTKNENGVWELFLPAKEYKTTFVHESKIKVHIVAQNGANDKIPAYITKVIQDPETHDFAGQLWFSEKFEWEDKTFKPNTKEGLFIYECHVGMAQEKEGLGTYTEFKDFLLPRIKEQGYNAIQLMAIQEHPYYGSYGYHVSNLFAPSSRFGTPEDLKALVNEAHKLGITVIMDLIHSHAVKNQAEGLVDFDGTDQYFHAGGRGYHELWDSKLYDYNKWEVKQFLLSNVKYWIEEFHFDGYRFDGITSMLYFHHGNYVDFDHYDKYFVHGVDTDAFTYLQLANTLIHKIDKNAISVAEDMSGMPGLCRQPEEGGVGFDYRLGMGIPDYWIKTIKEKRDEEWNINEIWGMLSNRRFGEKTVSYAESHDQALVGDKTLAFWLMDKEMYWHMSKDDDNLIIERGMALHKLMRMITISLGGEAYLTFFGNEFGHPEWIDFPRLGNNWSYKYAKRQWSLVDNENLKYKQLHDFDKQMIALMKENKILLSNPAQQINMDTTNQVIIFERNNLIFIFNFSPSNSIADYRFRVINPGKYKIILNSDSKQFGGHGRVDDTLIYESFTNFGPDFLSLYVTNRTTLVLKLIN